ncbi:ATP-dependent Clp protease ATP-binding subunit [Spirosoma utsteinense]|uniref:ATP-dependent Clp protease ATP-binding subunit ClpA n=1 Tax=Spirosoma utsteinense TaxID=2585773 RepID=A0ABR6WE65_9BACT|nr:ATP-dependent Clp protease ATP-binding subunit [Spirosoma utsteinense]MBC3788311.1 ATP-dependent Clp protease ATP-binding subunit ClpA [Spirosoma utsteinense]MBC3794217.1 ATP-dependent Clp protease ATP-binding subunit ClpA [Spirosoma utsteinense]
MAYTEAVKRAIQIAQALSKEYQNELFTPAHLLMGLLHNEVGLGSWLAMIGQDVPYLREWAEVRLEASPKASRLSPNPPGDEQVKSAMELADLVAMQLNKTQTDPVCVLIALLKPGVAFSAEQLRSLPLTQVDLMHAALADSDVETAISPDSKAAGQPAASQAGVAGQALLRYCVDKTAMAAEGRLDPILGRDREVRMMTETLGRRTKPNVILVGEPGVGKTALADGFALNIVAGQVPNHLQNARLLELDLGALVAGASYKGEVEDRLKSILKELKQDAKIILFIDEIHQLLDSRGPLGTGVANLLKPELAKGNLTVIGATTLDEYRKYIETDEAFSRRFDVLRVEEPDVETAIRMVQRLVPFYEKHHQLSVGADAVAEAVGLAKRYSRNRRLPDAAIDLLDRTLSAVRMISERTPAEVAQLSEQLDQLTVNTHRADTLRDLRYLHQELENKISPILLASLAADSVPDEEPVTDPFASAPALADHIRQTLNRLTNLNATEKTGVDRHDVAAVISHKTGIPLGKIQRQERDKLLNIMDVLKQRVIGQDHAVKAVADAILEARSGLTKAGQPIGSFFLLGPTGTGKTELAKSLADFLFNDESFLIRFDMSEFKEEHSAALLYGAPPGYVGYEEGGLLVNKIREKPYSVVLFDEIEKAHPSVFDIFLQILDEGRLHDRLGKEGDFSDAVVLFTSNIGSQLVIERFGEGQIPTTAELMESMSRHFRPEFLARLTEIVPFAPISQENAVRIFELHLRGLTDQLQKQGISLELSPAARRHLALSGFTPQYGARQLKGVIRNQLRRPISRMIVAGEVSKGSVVSVDSPDGQQLTWEYQHQEAGLQPVDVL